MNSDIGIIYYRNYFKTLTFIEVYSHPMRSGLVGALMDEYERALDEFIIIAKGISDTQFFEQWTTDDRFSSLKDILRHTCGAGFAYADFIRKVRGMDIDSPDDYIQSITLVESDLRSMFDYTLETVKDLYDLTEPQAYAMIIPVWGEDKYHLEQLLEHAIVHILRHRRQIEYILEKN